VIDLTTWYNRTNILKGCPRVFQHRGRDQHSGGASMKSIPSSGVYVITNTVNGHKYIGSAINLNRRKGEHFAALDKGKHHSAYLQRAYNKYGKSCFTFSVLKYCNRSELIDFEQQAMDQYRPEYNIAPRAGSQLGYKHTKETLAKLSKKLKGRIISPEQREKLRAALVGKKRPSGVVEKIRKGLLGRVMSSDWRANLSASHKGNKHTPEQIEKIRAAHLGRKNTPETIAKMKESARRRVARQRGEDND
jgi:group I intron endonuclease